MLSLTKSDVKLTPFPHVLSTALLDKTLYENLRKDYPDNSIFSAQVSESGLTGSRTGQGFDIYRGDTAYDRLLSDSTAWRDFDAFINSPAFIEKFLEIFGDELEATGCKHAIRPDMYSRDLIEGREVLTAHATIRHRIESAKKKFLGKRREQSEDVKLFTRLDIHKARSGYAKKVHCDRPNRLCSLIVYFCDAETAGFEGGDLTIHQHKQKKSIDKYERHPDPNDAPVIATVHPKENTGVFFPCCNNSYHGVTEMKANGAERDYLYINISGDSKSLW